MHSAEYGRGTIHVNFSSVFFLNNGSKFAKQKGTKSAENYFNYYLQARRNGYYSLECTQKEKRKL